MSHAVLPGMVRNGSGRVVNISSDAGRVGSSAEAAYSACKGGIIAFTKTTARELARNGVRLNAVAPGPTGTPLFAEVAKGEAGAKIAEGLRRSIPMKRLAQPTDYPICFLASDDAAYISGQAIQFLVLDDARMSPRDTASQNVNLPNWPCSSMAIFLWGACSLLATNIHDRSTLRAR